MFDNKIGYNYKTANGIQVFDDFGAVLDMRCGPGQVIQIAVDGWIYKNFTVTEDSFEGEECDHNDGIWGQTNGCVTSNTPTGDTLGVQWEIPNEYAQNTHRIAMYTSNEGGGNNTFTQFNILTYDVVNERYAGDPSWDYVEMSDSIFMIGIGIPYQNPPGYIQSVSATLFNIRTRANTIKAQVSTQYLGTYYQITNIATNIPLFDSEAHCRAYLENPEHTTGILNYVEPDPEEDYNNQFLFYYIKSASGHNTRNVNSSAVNKYNLRFTPKMKGIAFIKHTPTAAEPWDRELVRYSSYTKTAAPWGVDDEDAYETVTSVPTHYLAKNVSFGANDYYTCFSWESNIFMFNNLQEVEDYYNGIIGPEAADNYDYVSRLDDSAITPDLPGLSKESTSLKTNGMQYGYGCRLYAITNIELASLFNELFDPANLNSILDGQKVFGQDGITQSIAGILYLPLADLSDICDLGRLSNIKIGAWSSSNAQGKRINNNSGVINAGSFVLTPTYNDFRDFSPYTKLYVVTGYWGSHELDISKYYKKTVSCKIAIDVNTGATSLMIFGDNVLYDIFEGTCGASRPFVATDNNAYINNVINAISGASNSAGGAIGGVTSAVGDAGKMASAGGAVGAVGGAAGVAVAGAGVAASGIYAGYNIKNAVDSPPQFSKGSLSGNLAYYSASKINFLIAQKRTIRPENELAVIGYPSGHGGRVSLYSGYLKCSTFKLNNFTGTQQELNDLLGIMSQGIYI